MTEHSSKVRHDLQKRILRRLDTMDSAGELEDLNIPGFDFHGLEGKPKRYSIHINGPFCLTFEWEDDDIYRIDLENYH
jgi:proteic killer suppression protein